MTTTCQSSASSASTTCEPMKPAPPVTIAHLFGIGFLLRRAASARHGIDESHDPRSGSRNATRQPRQGDPKVLIDIEGEPFLERQLRYLERNGITHAVVNAHHHAAQLLAFAETYSGRIDSRS